MTFLSKSKLNGFSSPSEGAQTYYVRPGGRWESPEILRYILKRERGSLKRGVVHWKGAWPVKKSYRGGGGKALLISASYVICMSSLIGQQRKKSRKKSLEGAADSDPANSACTQLRRAVRARHQMTTRKEDGGDFLIKADFTAALLLQNAILFRQFFHRHCTIKGDFFTRKTKSKNHPPPVYVHPPPPSRYTTHRPSYPSPGSTIAVWQTSH